MVTSDELAELSHVAVAFGVTRADAERAHRQYLAQVAAAAWEDEVVTEAERADLLEVARLLAIPADEALAILEASKHSEQVPFRSDGLLRAGDKVAFTGEMEHRREELEELARAAGLRVMTSVSAKTALLVVADPHSESAKARAARECGVRSVAEQVFLHLVGQSQGDPGAQV